MIGTILFTGDLFNSIWYAINWACLILVGVYFATNTKNKWLRWSLSALVGWVFSAFVFEIICIVRPEMITTIDKPSATTLWYLMAFLITLTLITLTHGRKTLGGTSKDN